MGELLWKMIRKSRFRLAKKSVFESFGGVLSEHLIDSKPTNSKCVNYFLSEVSNMSSAFFKIFVLTLLC
jgi:hypothetical protein